MTLYNLIRNQCILSFDSESLSSAAVDVLGIHCGRGTLSTNTGIQQRGGFKNVRGQSSLSTGDTGMGKTDLAPAPSDGDTEGYAISVQRKGSHEKWLWLSVGACVHRLEQMLFCPISHLPSPPLISAEATVESST